MTATLPSHSHWSLLLPAAWRAVCICLHWVSQAFARSFACRITSKRQAAKEPEREKAWSALEHMMPLTDWVNLHLFWWKVDSSSKVGGGLISQPHRKPLGFLTMASVSVLFAFFPENGLSLPKKDDLKSNKLWKWGSYSFSLRALHWVFHFKNKDPRRREPVAAVCVEQPEDISEHSDSELCKYQTSLPALWDIRAVREERKVLWIKRFAALNVSVYRRFL